MAQRGGSVSSHTRWGDKVRSPLIAQGEADFLVSLERLEAMRYVQMLRPGGTALIGSMRIPPLSVGLTASSGSDAYPDDDQVRLAVGTRTDRLCMVPSLELAQEAGNIRAHNVVVLGVLSSFIAPLGGEVPPETWLDTILQWVPERYQEQNRRAFWAGRKLGLSSTWEV